MVSAMVLQRPACEKPPSDRVEAQLELVSPVSEKTSRSYQYTHTHLGQQHLLAPFIPRLACH